MRQYLFIFLLSFWSISSFSQGIATVKNYPVSDFRYPLDLAPAISGTFGEVRSNHLHSGMDIRTNQSVGHPVYAVADGYICRLRVQIGGFGNAVYINHPNGYTSVYAHLQRFNPRIAKTIKDYQYNQQQYDVDFPLLPINIPVRKGEIIAWSGNTGSSGGPHLHFEIRDTNTEEIINPQLFGVTIPDNVKPIIIGIYSYSLNNEPFNEKTPKQYFQVKGSAGDYSLVKNGEITLNGQTAFGITAYDQTLVGGNHNGVYSIELKIDNKTVYMSTIDRFAFDDSQAANSYIDYPELLNSGRMIQKSFIEPGNPLPIYKTALNKGLINISDTFTHKAEYIVKDVKGNTSTLAFTLKGGGRTGEYKDVGAKKFYYNKTSDFSTDAVKVSVPAGALYSTIDFGYSQSAKTTGFSPVHHIHTRQIPLHQDYSLWIKPDASLDPDLYDKALIVDTRGKSYGGDYEGGYVKTMAGSFGNFYLATDNIPPVINPINISDGKSLAGVSRMTFRISDNLSGIKSFRGTIDGNWILMEFDQKTATLWHTFDERTSSGKHTFQLEVTDKKLNIKTYTATFYR